MKAHVLFESFSWWVGTLDIHEEMSSWNVIWTGGVRSTVDTAWVFCMGVKSFKFPFKNSWSWRSQQSSLFDRLGAWLSTVQQSQQTDISRWRKKQPLLSDHFCFWQNNYFKACMVSAWCPLGALHLQKKKNNKKKLLPCTQIYKRIHQQTEQQLQMFHQGIWNLIHSWITHKLQSSLRSKSS